MRSRIWYLVISLAILAADQGLPCHGQVTSNVLRRVLLIQATEEGTGFTIEVDGRQYIVTAKHLVAGLMDQAESTINLKKKNGWVPLKVRVFKCDDPVDIAVLVASAQLTVNFQLDPTSKGMAVGQDAFFVGFPFGASITYNSLPDVFGFVRKATVAALERFPEKKAQIIHLDGFNNPGFSGSPVVFHDLSSQNGAAYKVAGVVSGFVYDAGPVVKKTQEVQQDQVTPQDLQRGSVVRTISDGRFYRVEDTDQIVKLNTGIATAWDIGSAVELIRKHPVGPKTDDGFTGEEIQQPVPTR